VAGSICGAGSSDLTEILYDRKGESPLEPLLGEKPLKELHRRNFKKIYKKDIRD